jgi:hypothetical protein
MEIMAEAHAPATLVTITRSRPSTWLRNEDLPTLGRPTMEIEIRLRASSASASASPARPATHVRTTTTPIG